MTLVRERVRILPSRPIIFLPIEWNYYRGKWIFTRISTRRAINWQSEKEGILVFDRGEEVFVSLRSRSKSNRLEWKRWKNGTRLVERAKTWFSLESRGRESNIKERRGKLWRGGDRWSLLLACRLPSTLDAVHSSYPSSSTRVLALPVLWPWTESIDLGVPLREHNRSRGSHSTTKYVLTPRTCSSPLFSSLPLAFFLSSTSLFPPSLLSYHLDSFRFIIRESMRLRKRRHRTLSFLPSNEAGQSLFLYRPIYRSIKLTVHNYIVSSVEESIFIRSTSSSRRGDYVK